MSRLPLFTKVDAALSVKVESGDLNNTTPELTFQVNNSGVKSAQVGDYVALWNKATYATPDLDANARIGRVLERSNTELTVRWGEFGTPIVAYTGRPELAVAFKSEDQDTVLLEQLSELGKQNEQARVANFSLTAADTGILQVINADGLVGSLPAHAAGLSFDFEIGTTGTADGIGEIGFAISPVTADAINGGGVAAGTNDKDVLVTKATARKGDRIRVAAGAANKWVITHLAATITREP